jgi:hypothetical protein
MKFIGMVARVKLEFAGLGMRLAVWRAAGHSIAFVQFVQQHKTSFLFADGIVNPDFTLGHKFVDVIMPPRRKVNIENTAYESTIDNPDTDTVLQFLPQAFMHGTRIRQLPTAMGRFPDIAGAAPFPAFHAVCFNQCLLVWHPLSHQIMLCQ